MIWDNISGWQKNILKNWWFLQDNSVDSEKQLQMEEQKKKKKDEEKQEEKVGKEEEKVGKEEEKEEEETQNDTSEPQVDGLNGVYPWDQDLIVAHTYLMTINTKGAMH